MKRQKRTLTTPYTGTQAVLRAISLLKSFSEEEPTLTLVKLAEEAGLNKTTAYRLLTALESEGLVARDAAAEAYTLGSEIIVLGGQALRSNNLRTLSHPELKSLSDQTDETTSLEVLTGREVLILDEILGGHLMSGNQSIGTRWPAFATSTGKSIVAFLSMAEQEAFLRGPLPRLTERTITDPNALRREFAAIRKRGYAIADEGIELGFLAVGAPVFNHDAAVVAAISVGGPRIRIAPAKITHIGSLVRASADRISARLGYRSAQSR